MSEEGRKSGLQRQSSEERFEAVLKVGLVLAVSSLIFMTGFYLLVFYDVIQLYPKGWNEDLIKGFALKAEYTLRYQTLLMFWLLFSIFATIYGRIASKAINPLEERTEGRVAMFKSTLTNSFEQIFLSVVTQLIFVSFADSVMVLKYIPLVNVVQFIGRIAFFAGYPMKRSFGFLCTVLPTIVLNFYNVFKLGSFVGLY